MEKKYDIVLFDLDGTLFDTGEGILNGVRYTLKQMDRPIPPENVLRRFIGPPMWDSFRDFCGMTQQQAEEGVRIFRKRYWEVNWMETYLYAGLKELLRDLKAAGVKISTATSKPQKMSRHIIKHFGIEAFFDDIVGSNEDGSRSVKKELIPYAIARCGGAPLNRVVMVGDTLFDFIGAAQVGTDFIGVTYGYGTRQEFLQEGAVKLAATADELRGYLFV